MIIFPLCGPRFPELTALHFICRRRRYSRAEIENLSDECLEDGSSKRLKPNLEGVKSYWMA